MRTPPPNKRIAAVLLLTLVMIAVLLSGCGATDEGPFTVYTYDAFPEPLIDLARDSLFDGDELLEVKRFADAGGVLTRLLAEVDSPLADVVVGLDATQLPVVLETGVLSPYRSAEIDAVDSSLIVDKTFHVVPFDYGGVTLNFDSERMSDPPETWDDLLDSRFEDSIILMNPAVSSPGRNFLLLSIHHFGIDGYLDYWRSLKPNVLTITGTWFEGYGLYTEGEAPIVVSYETSPAYHREFEGTDRYRSVFLDGNAYGQIEVAGIVSGTKRRKKAEAFIDLLLSEAFQREIPLNQFMYPARTGVALPPSFESNSRRTLVRLSATQVNANIDRWIDEWEAVMR